MSGFEPMFMAEAAVADAGTAALASEVLAPELLAPEFLGTVGGAEFGTPALFSGLEGLTGLAGLGTEAGLGSLAGTTQSVMPTLAEQIGATNPEILSQIQEPVLAAQPGANQVLDPARYDFLHNTYASAGPSAVSDAGAGNLFSGAAETPAAESVKLYGSQTQLPTYAAESTYGDIVPQVDNTIANAYQSGVMGGAPQGNGLMDAIKSMGSKMGQWWDQQPTEKKLLYGGAGLLGAQALLGKKQGVPEREPYSGPLSKFKYDPSRYTPYTPTPPTPYTPVYRNYRQYAGGGPVETMSNANAVGANTGYPMAEINKPVYASPFQTPVSNNVVHGASDTGVNPMTGEITNFARGGISDLGAYSDYARGGRMLKGPGDGMSDDIPATIANKQPARLANEEFVIPADVVSHLGNGSSEAGAKQLYKMMDRVRQARTGTKKQGKQINPEKYLA